MDRYDHRGIPTYSRIFFLAAFTSERSDYSRQQIPKSVNYAKQHDFAIVSKDSDFQHRSLVFGSPPKSIWLRVGNCKAKLIEDLLREYAAALEAFGNDETTSHLMLP